MASTLEGINNILNSFVPVEEEIPKFSLERQVSFIQECFGGDELSRTIPDIYDRVKVMAETGDEKASGWAQQTVMQMDAASPTALLITHEMLKRATRLSFKSCLQMEIGLAHEHVGNSLLDFKTGVTHRLINKTPGRPPWSPDTLKEASKSLDMKSIFGKPRELPFVNDTDYMEYPHAQYALPTARIIQTAIKKWTKKDLQTNSNRIKGEEEVLHGIAQQLVLQKAVVDPGKPGLRAKIKQLLIQHHKGQHE